MFDDTPSTMIISAVEWEGSVAVLEATDLDGNRWLGRLRCDSHMGSRAQWTSTISHIIATQGRNVPITSIYDENRDEWLCRVGNYGIFSKDIEWTEGWG